ncbi:N-acetylmuramoyl-L-alanine amidase [Streptoverticillium reticulum]|uniref:peptidoglycan recognition protein family protein n=1 Tax=Streptoverticillium reticulum TaxID=1433415 RepID=UPI0039BF117C
MRGILVTPAVTACAALTLPLLAPASFGAVPHRATGPERRPPVTGTAPAAPAGATRSLPLVPLGTARHAYGTASGTAGMGLPAQEVRPFSLIGIVWDDADTELHGRVQVRTRGAATHAWSGWQDIQAHDDDRPDPDSDEGRHSKVHGSTAPLWVGASDAVQVRVRPEPTADRQPAGHGGGLPRGMRAELVDPGRDPAPAPAGGHGRRAVTPPGPVPGGDNEGASSASAANSPLAPLGATEIPAADRPDSQRDVAAAHIGIGRITADWNTEDPETQDVPETASSQDTASIPLSPETDRGAEENADDSESAGRYVGPRPRIVTRAGWGADESMRERQFAYTKTVKAAFVHHTASGNGYSCSEASSVIRGIYRYHVVSSGWRDIGYNFLVDKCGTVYEGRAGGVAKAVKGAHTLGFNTNSMGIAVIGTFSKNSAPGAAVDAVARLAAWKLGLFGINPKGSVSLVSGGGNLYKKGTTVKVKAISGHRDGYATECPGDKLYSRLGTIRSTAARLQGR